MLFLRLSDNLVLSTKFMLQIGPCTVSKAEISSISPLSEHMEELWVVCGLYTERWSYTIGGNIVTLQTQG